MPLFFRVPGAAFALGRHPLFCATTAEGSSVEPVIGSMRIGNHGVDCGEKDMRWKVNL